MTPFKAWLIASVSIPAVALSGTLYAAAQAQSLGAAPAGVVVAQGAAPPNANALPDAERPQRPVAPPAARAPAPALTQAPAPPAPARQPPRATEAAPPSSSRQPIAPPANAVQQVPPVHVAPPQEKAIPKAAPPSSVPNGARPSAAPLPAPAAPVPGANPPPASSRPQDGPRSTPGQATPPPASALPQQPQPAPRAIAPLPAPDAAVAPLAPAAAPARPLPTPPPLASSPSPVVQPAQPLPAPVVRTPEKRSGVGPAGTLAIGAAAGLVGGFMAAEGLQRFEDVRRQRQETNDRGLTIIREPGRSILRQDNHIVIRHDENARFRDLGGSMRTEQRGDQLFTIYDRPDGSQIVTSTDGEGSLLRRVRRFPDGREIVLIDNVRHDRASRPYAFEDNIVELPFDRSPQRERYIINARESDERLIYETLIAPPIAPVARRYSLDQVRSSPDLRNRMRSIDIDTITFESGSWIVPSNQANQLDTIAQALKRLIQATPNEVFLVEGHTDAVGSDVDNLSLSDRRAQAVATVLSRDFGVPPENLTTQGYGEQYLKVQAPGPVRENRRATVRRITPLLADGAAAN